MRKFLSSVAIPVSMLGCSGIFSGGVFGDGPDDSFANAVPVDPETACAVLKMMNTEDVRSFGPEIKIAKNAISNIAAFREGTDATLGSSDDAWFSDLEALDAIKYVGPATFKKLQDRAVANPANACGAVDVQLLAINDFHGNLRPPAGSSGRIQTGPDAAVNRVDAGGVEFLATHISQLKQQNPNTVVVAAGDLVGASPLLSALFHDEPTIDSLNLLGLEISAVGNHEFDEGTDELLRMQYGGCHPVDGCQDGDDFGGADFQYLAANVIEQDSGEPLLPPFEVRQFGNARIAFIGLTLEGTPSIVLPSGIQTVDFLDEADTINALIPGLQARGVNSFVVLIHEGGAQVGLFNECVGLSGAIGGILSRLDPAVSIVVSGHTHAGYNCQVGGRIVTSAASFGRLVTDIGVTIDEHTGVVSTANAENVIVTRTVAPDPAQTALIAKYNTLVAPLANRIVASITADLTLVANSAGELAMGEVIADAQLEATTDPALGAAEISFMNPGGIRADLLVSKISGGEALGQVTHEEAFTVQPFGNNLATLTMTGAQIETLLESQFRAQPDGTVKAVILQVSQGFTYAWDSTKPAGDRIDPASIRLNGVTILPTQQVRVTVSNFLATGGDGFTTFISGTDLLGGAIDLDSFEAYLQAHSPLAAPPMNRITRL